MTSTTFHGAVLVGATTSTPAANAAGAIIVNKAYVDQTLQDPFVCDQVATSALGGTPTYSNAVPPATLTGTSGGFNAWATDNAGLNTPAFTVGMRILVTGQASSFQNGVYQLTQDGDTVALQWILTRVSPNWDSVGTVGGITIGDRVVAKAPAAAAGVWRLHQLGTLTAGNQTWLRAPYGGEPQVGATSTSTTDSASNYDGVASLLNAGQTLTALARRVFLTDSANTTITIVIPAPSATAGLITTFVNVTASSNTSGISQIDTGAGNIIDATGATYRYVNLASGQAIQIVSDGSKYRPLNTGFAIL
jgi:hypothetical protein